MRSEVAKLVSSGGSSFIVLATRRQHAAILASPADRPQTRQYVLGGGSTQPSQPLGDRCLSDELSPQGEGQTNIYRCLL